jgi:hypothetical protein
VVSAVSPHPPEADQAGGGEHVSHHRQAARHAGGRVGHRQDAGGDDRVVLDMAGQQFQAGIRIVEGGEDLDHDAREGRQLRRAADDVVATDGARGHHALR